MKIDDGKIKLLLANRRMMVKELAKKAYISENALCSIRQGKSQPRPATIGKIACALGVNVEDILIKEGEENE